MVGKNQKGFTLIELLVVIVIIGILIALTLPNLFAAQQRGRDTTRKNDLANIQKKLETYFSDHNAYPNSTELPSAGVQTTDLVGPRGDAYKYDVLPTGCDSADATTNPCQSYTLSATLENTKDKAAATDGSGTYTVKSVNQ